MGHIQDMIAPIMSCPYLICGDFNMEPDELHQLNWAPAAKGHILQVKEPVTCAHGARGSKIDLGVADTTIHHLTSDPNLVKDVPCSPHFGISYQLRAKPDKIRIKGLVKPGSIGLIAKGTSKTLVNAHRPEHLKEIWNT